MPSALSLSLLCAAFVALAASQGVHFDCPALPPLTQPAKTVYELRPQDIKVVMALGDSITAGTEVTRIVGFSSPHIVLTHCE